ncbi:MAG: TOBE domain-containing protein [Candidatus Kuenenia sp.]|nr:TOBE domain-containing protein [Candidatus Kuenenia sp.]
MACKLNGKIMKINKGRIHTHIQIMWKDIPLSAVITTASCDDMNLFEGDAISVLMKSTDLILAKAFRGILSARNFITGVVVTILRGDVLSKVIFESQGDTLCAIITNASLEEMNIQTGEEITAIVKSTELILFKDKKGISMNGEGRNC